MLPTPNHPARLYRTAKTHKFHSLDIITTEQLKVRPIIAHTGTYIYIQCSSSHCWVLKTNCWWKPNPYRICITQDFPFILNAEPPLEIDEEYVYMMSDLCLPIYSWVRQVITSLLGFTITTTMCSKTNV